MNPYAVRARFTDALETYTRNVISYHDAMIDLHMDEESRNSAITNYIASRRVLFDMIVVLTPTRKMVDELEDDQPAPEVAQFAENPAQGATQEFHLGTDTGAVPATAIRDDTGHVEDKRQIPVIGVRRPIPFVVSIRKG